MSDFEQSATMTEREALARRVLRGGLQRGPARGARRASTSDDYRSHDPQDPRPDLRGPAAARAVVEHVPRRVPDVRFTIEDVVEQRDRVAIRWTATGTHRGELNGLAPDRPDRERSRASRSSAWPAAASTEAWTNWDTLGLLQQIGALPPRAASRRRWACRSSAQRRSWRRRSARAPERALRARHRSLGSPNTGRAVGYRTDADEGRAAMERMPDDVGERTLRTSSPPASALRTSISCSRWAPEFGAVDGDAVRERLDDDSRALFGFGELSPLARADRLAAVMDRELGLAADRTPGRPGLLFDQVVAAAHAAIPRCSPRSAPSSRCARASRRACTPRRSRWFVGVGLGEELVVLDARLGEGSAEPPRRGPRRLRARARVLRALRPRHRVHAAGPRRRCAPRRAPAPLAARSSRAARRRSDLPAAVARRAGRGDREVEVAQRRRQSRRELAARTP